MPVYVIDTLKPKNDLDFPVVEAEDVEVSEGLRLPEALSQKAEQTDLEELSSALEEKADTSDITDLQAQIDQIAQTAGTGTADTEIGQARVGADGTSYQTLKARLDAENAEIKNELPNYELEPYDITNIKNEGFVRSSNGTINDGYTGFFYTDLIALSAGETIQVEAEGTGTSVAWLSKWESAEATSGTVIEIAEKGERVITYTATNTVEYIRLSNSNEKTFTVYKGTMSVPSSLGNAIVLTVENVPSISGTVAEVKNAETNAENIKFASLKARLDAENLEIKSELPSYVLEPYDFSEIKNTGFVRSSDGAIVEYNGFFYTDLIELSAGDRIVVTAKSTGTSVAWLSKWESAEATSGTVIEISATTETTFTYTATETTELIRLSNIDSELYDFIVEKGNVIVPDTLKAAITSELEKMDILPKSTTITVGTGKDYETLNAAVNSITNSGPDNKYIIELYEGTYETVDESLIAARYKGLIIPDYVSIKGIGNRDRIIIKGEILDSAYSEYANDISTINYTMNGTVENVTITSKNIRYCNHDDAGTFGLLRATHTFKHVKFITYQTDSDFSVQGIPVGIGGQWDKEVNFENCEFISYNGEGSHNNAILCHDGGINGVRLNITNCLFDIQPGYYDVRLSNSGSGQLCFAVINNCKLTKGIRYSNGVSSPSANVWNLFATGNYNYSLLNSTSFDISSAVTEFGNSYTQE